MAKQAKRSAQRRRGRSARRGAGSEGSAFRQIAQEAAGIVLLGVALLGAIALLTYHPADPAFRIEPVENAAGVAGASLAALLVGATGAGALVPVAGLFALGTLLLTSGRVNAFRSRFWVSAGLLLMALSTGPALLEHLAPGQFAFARGGRLGEWLAGLESTLFSAPGALALNAMLLGVGTLGIAGASPGRGLLLLAEGGAAASRLLGEATLRAARLTRRALGEASELAVAVATRGTAAITVWREQRARRRRTAAAREPAIADGPDLEEEQKEPPPKAVLPAAGARRAEAPDIVDHRADRKPEKPEQEAFTFNEGGSAGPYDPPDIDLFQRPPEGARQWDRDSLIMNSRILEKKLADFGVQGRVVTVHPGPVITMYEFEPAAGVKVNRITNLSDDLALALRAISIRIIAPIPGKSVVGIEVPNPNRDVVYLRDLLESRSFRQSESKLTLALGKDIFGNPVDADLATMPHLLVAGATGTGKSVFLNSLLCSILFRARPDEVKLLLVDPKLLELSIYEGIPHLIADVVTNPKRASAALRGIVQKMEERYQRMAALGVRNIRQYNERADEALAEGETHFRLKPKPGETEGEEVAWERLPYIVVVIDELADLMVVSARDVEESLQRLAQMARASGIHLVLATQRPSVDVLTGIIKANFPSRLSFQVSSRTDSRTILDQGGAETLLGQGDMLFLPPGTSKLQRLHGSFVTEKEVASLVEHLRSQGKPQFDEDLTRLPEETENAGDPDEETDEHYDRALAIVAETQNASISYVQRRLKIGYNRAARIVEQMEREGVVGPQVGTRPREVFVRPIGEDEE
ncbi:MAG: DNA translocase FtsK 4TM domain-containing protein [Myxococcota bacterium]|nr:DNA translocase FtsK 4TM domain-containing protein [Myxococcota bacterium]